LNIDPTDEDSWTFTTISSNATLFYQLFDENGAKDADGNSNQAVAFTSATAGDIAPAGVFTIDRNGSEATATTNPIINFRDNADTICLAEGGSAQVLSSDLFGHLHLTVSLNQLQ
jgi:hypothetical protein